MHLKLGKWKTAKAIVVEMPHEYAAISGVINEESDKRMLVEKAKRGKFKVLIVRKTCGELFRIAVQNPESSIMTIRRLINTTPIFGCFKLASSGSMVTISVFLNGVYSSTFTP